MKQLENCKWSPHWVSHLGCVKGCVDFLGLDISNAWLFGGTGHAFIINLHEEVCPSGPTAWNTEMLSRLGRNLGYQTDCVFGHKSGEDFAGVQRRAWEHVRDAIDRGLPCYGWELEIPEFYVVYGYDDEGYYFSGAGCDEGRGPKPWQELGDTGIGVVEMYRLSPHPAADAATVVREALTFALEHATSPEKWVFPNYKAGFAGYDNWIASVERGTAGALGMAYNAGVWAECRNYAAEFLGEAGRRIDGRAAEALDEARQHYAQVAKNFKRVSDMYPFSAELGEEAIGLDDRNGPAAEALKAARGAEEAGQKSMASILEILGSSD
jgi:hypothetical protein